MIKVTRKDALNYARMQHAKILLTDGSFNIDAIFYNSGYFGCNFRMSKAYFHNGSYIVFLEGFRNFPKCDGSCDYDTYKSIIQEACK